MAIQFFNNGNEAELIDMPADTVLSVSQASPGALANVYLVRSDSAIGFISANLSSSTPLVVGPFTANCTLAVSSIGRVAVDIGMQLGGTGGSINPATLPIASGVAAFRAAFGYSGATQATSTPVLLPIADAGTLTAINLAAGNTNITVAMMRSGVLVSTSSGSTSILVPTLATITDIGAYVFDVNNPTGLFFSVQRRGLGVLAVNFAAGVTLISHNLDPVNLPQNHIPTSYWLVATDTWMEM